MLLEVGVFLIFSFSSCFPFLSNCIIFNLPIKETHTQSPHYLGTGLLIIFTLFVFLCLRKRRKDKFNGNFDPFHLKGDLSGTLPKIDLGEEVDEDDGMGGRLGAGPGCGGIISPYTLKHALELERCTVNGVGQQHQNQPRMQLTSNIGVASDGVGAALAARCSNKKRAM